MQHSSIEYNIQRCCIQAEYRYCKLRMYYVPKVLARSNTTSGCIHSIDIFQDSNLLASLNTSYLTDLYISFILKFQQNFCSNRSIRSSTYGKKNIFEIPPRGSHFLVIHFTYLLVLRKMTISVMNGWRKVGNIYFNKCILT